MAFPTHSRRGRTRTTAPIARRRPVGSRRIERDRIRRWTRRPGVQASAERQFCALPLLGLLLSSSLALCLAPSPAVGATGGELWGYAIIETTAATPPVTFPSGTVLVASPPLSSDALDVNPPIARDDPRSGATASAAASIGAPEPPATREFFSCFLEADSDGDILISDPVVSECRGTWTQAFVVTAPSPEPVDIRLEWVTTGSTFVDRFGDRPLGSAEIDFTIEMGDGTVVAQGTSEARRDTLTGGPPFEELQDEIVTGDWTRLPGGDVDGEGERVIQMPPGSVFELFVDFGARAFVREESTGNSQVNIDVRIEPVPLAPDSEVTAIPVPEPQRALCMTAGLTTAIGLAALRRRRPHAPRDRLQA